MRQTEAAKRIFREIKRRPDVEFGFPLCLHPRLSRFADEHLPEIGKIVLLGGDRGTAGQTLSALEREFVNIEIGGIAAPLVPIVRGDMENADSYRGLRNGTGISFFSPCSMEFADIGLTGGHVADTLKRGERLVCLCHHANGKKAGEFEKIRTIYLALADMAAAGIETQSHEKLERAVKTAEDRIGQGFGFDIMPDRVSNMDEIFVHGLKREMMGENAGNPGNMGLEAYIAVCEFALGIVHRDLGKRMPGINGIIGAFKNNMEIALPALDANLRTPEDLARLVDQRLKLVAGEIYSEDFGLNRPVAVCAAFERV